MQTKRVVITGMGALTPIGNNLQDYWNGLKDGANGCGPITKFDPSKFKTHFACELKNFNAEDFIDKKEARKMDPFVQYAIVASDEAIKNANINFEDLNRNRIGVIWSSGNGGMLTFEEQLLEYAKGDGTPRFNPFFIAKILVDICAGMISMRHGLRGINYCPVSACASANTAIIDGFNYIRLGMADMIITGGSDAAITRSGIGGFGAMKALSTRNEDPASASRPFDIDRDGFVMGEGAGALILEDLDHALNRGAVIYGEVIGGGMSADAYHLTSTHPDGLGAQLAMKQAIDVAGIKKEEIDYINLHATSTSVGDISELKAVKSLFGDHVKNIHVSATKSMTGHLLGAAGAVEGIAAVMTCRDNIIHPTINTKNIDPEIPEGFNLTLGKAVHKTVHIAMSNTFGFGGHNAIVLFKKYVK